MKNIIYASTVLFLFLVTEVKGQLLSTSNHPSQTTSRSALAAEATVYGVFVGRTPCQEFMKELKTDVNAACAKRKMGITLYQDPVTHRPTTYQTWGMGKWTGKGNWHILHGTPGDPKATVFKLDLDTNTFLLLLKGDENVLFVLDRNKNFLIGNGHFSYTFNRAN